ncbi:MAG: cyclic nucleotide-binding domain-containing protein [Thermoleophilia bacterium]|nr:cyclic nucleotide-binding domain-containing protein [Thermoleophilia bacterium]MDQ3858670.1 cyclic nucleotide-binding domain-containing protein [Actinomycetota bacterium]
MLFTHDTKVESLRRAPLFAELSKHELESLAKGTEDLEVDAGKVLCREGEPAMEFFVIIDGEVEVTRDGRPIRTLRSGDFFGEIALLEDLPRTATVTATTPLRFFVLTRQSFWGLVDRSPEVERKLLRTLARRLVSDDPTLSER